MRSDLRLALRLLRREPAFAAVAILTLALGIAANAAIFSVVNGVLLQPLGYAQPSQLMALQEVVPQIEHLYPTIPVNAPAYLAWTQQAHSFTGIALAQSRSLNLTGVGQPALLNAGAVTANLFSVLGALPRLGRTFLPDADQAGHDREVVLTDSLWRNTFHANPDIVGHPITLNGSPYVVAGVLPATFRFPKGNELGPFVNLGPKVELFVPIVFSKNEQTDGGEFNYAAIGRLKPGVTEAQALAELNVIQAGVSRRFPQMGQVQASIMPLRDMIAGPVQRGLWLLLAAVLVVLLIVCVNLANLMLARATGRRRDAAIRGALGASTRRLMRQVLTETVLLGLIGGAVGVLFANFALRVLLQAAPASLPRLEDVHMNGAVLWFTFALSVLAGLAAGLLPAWRLARSNPQQALRAGGARTGESGASLRAREALVAIETALSAVLLIVAGLLLGSFARLMSVPKGFEVDRILAVDLHLPQAQYTRDQQRQEFWQRALAATAALPGVRDSALVSSLPLEGEQDVNPITLPGDTRPVAEQPLANFRQVSPDYFRILGIPLIAGRALTAADQGLPRVVVSATTAAKVWPRRNPLGQTFHRGDPNEKPQVVVGVVGDMRAISLLKPPGLMVYRPYEGNSTASLLLRTPLDPVALAPAVRRAIGRIDPNMPVPVMRSMRQLVAASVAPRRFQMLLVLLFAGAALLLACLGIYGVVSYSVARRTNEMGIRLALGARAPHLYRMILRQGMAPVVIGLVVGVGGALAIGRLLASLLFEMRPSDPATIAAVALGLGAVGVLACLLPARRAVRVDPTAALRYE